jgi:hypothetical protein
MVSLSNHEGSCTAGRVKRFMVRQARHEAFLTKSNGVYAARRRARVRAPLRAAADLAAAPFVRTALRAAAERLEALRRDAARRA